MISTNDKSEDITNAVIGELTVSCAECGITNDIIDQQSFTCFPESPTYVTYHARLEGTSETDSDSLISPIDEWVSDGVSIIVTGVLMTVDSGCSAPLSVRESVLQLSNILLPHWRSGGSYSHHCVKQLWVL